MNAKWQKMRTIFETLPKEELVAKLDRTNKETSEAKLNTISTCW